MNTVFPSIKFTKQLEKSRILASLDVTLQYLENVLVPTSVHRNPTHTDQYFQYLLHYRVKQKLVWIVHSAPELITSYLAIQKTADTKILTVSHLHSSRKKCQIFGGPLQQVQ